jgi:hypothetical protein
MYDVVYPKVLLFVYCLEGVETLNLHIPYTLFV